jgi:hypothetical protein
MTTVMRTRLLVCGWLPDQSKDGWHGSIIPSHDNEPTTSGHEPTWILTLRPSRELLTHINVYFYLSTKYRKGHKMNINIDLGVCYKWIPWVLVNYIFSETIQENAKRMNSRRLQKTLELNRSGLQENMHLEGTRGPHAKTEPGLGPA